MRLPIILCTLVTLKRKECSLALPALQSSNVLLKLSRMKYNCLVCVTLRTPKMLGLREKMLLTQNADVLNFRGPCHWEENECELLRLYLYMRIRQHTSEVWQMCCGHIINSCTYRSFPFPPLCSFSYIRFPVSSTYFHISVCAYSRELINTRQWSKAYTKVYFFILFSLMHLNTYLLTCTLSNHQHSFLFHLLPISATSFLSSLLLFSSFSHFLTPTISPSAPTITLPERLCKSR